MSFRKEEKLYIKSDHILEFKKFLKKHSVKNLFEPRKIKSLYFDNLNLDMYNDSIEGTVPRKKVRIREYPETKDKKYYLEIKYSSVEGRFKTREIIKSDKFEFLKRAGYFDNRYGICLPNFYVSYNREYYLVDDIRVTIDKDIQYNQINLNKISSINVKYEKKYVLEIKTDIKKNLTFLLNNFDFPRSRFSKYERAIQSFI